MKTIKFTLPLHENLRQSVALLLLLLPMSVLADVACQFEEVRVDGNDTDAIINGRIDGYAASLSLKEYAASYQAKEQLLASAIAAERGRYELTILFGNNIRSCRIFRSKQAHAPNLEMDTLLRGGREGTEGMERMAEDLMSRGR